MGRWRQLETPMQKPAHKCGSDEEEEDEGPTKTSCKLN
jgi:hypothetical protein